jgi:dihydrodipicolinate synthase/N-acetylneuraminate lyase
MAVQGLIVPPAAPMDDAGETLNLGAVPNMVEMLIAGGAHGLFINGTTGEGSLLALDERERLAEAFVAAAAGRVATVVQVGATSTPATLRLTRHAVSLGVDAIAVVAPYYFRHDQAALERHLETVAEVAGSVPTYAYEIPSRTQNSYGVELIRRLAERGVIAGTKDSSGDLPRILELLAIPGLHVLPGADHLGLIALQRGAKGMVSGPAGVWPQPYVRLWNAFRDGDLDGAARWQRVVVRASEALAFGADIPLLKRLVGELVPGVGGPRPPHRAPAADRVRVARETLANIAAEAGLELESRPAEGA